VLIVDDILLFPVRSILWIFREIHNTAQEELAGEADSIADQLRNLYMQLETAGISEQQFEDQEKLLLDRLDKMEARPGSQEDGEEPEDTQVEEESERYVRHT
jgi:ribosome assembly protein YihI (activator of Der GTPase)